MGEITRIDIFFRFSQTEEHFIITFHKTVREYSLAEEPAIIHLKMHIFLLHFFVVVALYTFIYRQDFIETQTF